VIKTTMAGDALTRALEKQQRWADDHRDDRKGSIETSVRKAGRPNKLRMAKARLVTSEEQP